MTLAQFTELDLLVPHLQSEHRDGAITELSQRLQNARRVEDAPMFAQAVLNHEKLVSAVFETVAFSLARTPAAKKLSFAVGLSRQGIQWSPRATDRVHTLVLFAVPLAEADAYLSLALTFSRLIRNENSLTALQSCGQPEQMLELLKRAPLVRHGPPARQGSALAEF